MLTFKHSIGPDVRIRFSEKPEERIRAMLKANGYRWSPAAGEWWRRGCRGAADFLAALDRAIGPRRPDGACWVCGEPEGYFRNEGAASPVRCEACQAAIKQKQARAETGTALDRIDLDHEDRCREACGL